MAQTGGWRTGLGRLAPTVPPFALEPKKTALVIIDMQYCDAHPDYGLGIFFRQHYPDVHSYYFGRLAQVVMPNHKKLLEFFRRNALRIVYVAVGSLLPDKSDLHVLRKQRESAKSQIRPAVLGTVGSFEHRILDEIAPQEGELVINKNSYGAFNSTAIDQLLRNMQVECLVITGVATYGCVLATALDAADRGYKCVVVEDAVAGPEDGLHNAALGIFHTTCGRVETADAVCAELQKALSVVP